MAYTLDDVIKSSSLKNSAYTRTIRLPTEHSHPAGSKVGPF